MSARYSAILMNMGMARSKWVRDGLHQPPLLLGWAKFGGQQFVFREAMFGSELRHPCFGASFQDVHGKVFLIWECWGLDASR
ncbi:hypothetical protein ACFX2I_010682 [Malus domestica]